MEMAESLQIRREIIYDKIEYFFKPFFEFFPEFFYFGHFSNLLANIKNYILVTGFVEGLYFCRWVITAIYLTVDELGCELPHN